MTAQHPESAPYLQIKELVETLMIAAHAAGKADGLNGAYKRMTKAQGDLTAAILRALSLAPTLTWTVNRLTEPGFYLCVEPGKTDAEMERVYMDETVTEWYSPGLRRWEPIPTGTKWLGPIPLSIEPKPPEVTT